LINAFVAPKLLLALSRLTRILELLLDFSTGFNTYLTIISVHDFKVYLSSYSKN
jgi:hypothetical protein